MRQADDLETLRSTLSHGRESETSSRPGIGRWGGEVPADLHHPGFVGTRRNSGNLDPARFQLDHEEHIERDETAQAPDLDGEEVGSGEHGRVRFEELAPRHPFPTLGTGVNPIPL
jgi:hypothetical protein